MLAMVYSAIFKGLDVDSAAAVFRALLYCDPVFAHGLNFFSGIGDEEFVPDKKGRRALSGEHVRQSLETLLKTLGSDYSERIEHPCGYAPLFKTHIFITGWRCRRPKTKKGSAK